MASRKYEIVLLGATGYTGALTAKHIATRFPADLRWAIAGRSKDKLYKLAAEIAALRPHGSKPDIEVVDLDQAAGLDAVVKATKVLISVVTYWRVGDVVIQSCIDNGTDYIDTSGGTDMTKGWIDKFHDKAEAAGLILACGMLTGPHDVLALASARAIKNYGSTTKEFVLSVKTLSTGVSGGSFESIASHAGEGQPKFGAELENPWILSPVQGTNVHPAAGRFGLRRDDTLGVISKHALTAAQDQAIVHRTWGLLRGTNQDFGPNFQYNEYTWVGSTVGGIFTMLSTLIISKVLGSSIGIGLLKYVMPAPGSGPDVAKAARTPVRLEAVAIPDDDNIPRVRSSFAYPSGSYHTTALFLGEGAASLLYTRSLEGGIRGGCLTPALLGQDLLKRLLSAGATINMEYED